MAGRANGIARGVYRHLSSYSDEWFTPADMVKSLGPFDLDPCAGPMRHARRNIRRPKCGLSAKWKGRVWLNPPYSDLHPWLDKFAEHGDGICLVNSRTETHWFHRLAAKASAIFLLRGRIKFGRPDGSKNNPPCGCVLLALGEENAEALRRAKLPGVFLRP